MQVINQEYKSWRAVFPFRFFWLDQLGGYFQSAVLFPVNSTPGRSLSFGARVEVLKMELKVDSAYVSGHRGDPTDMTHLTTCNG